MGYVSEAVHQAVARLDRIFRSVRKEMLAKVREFSVSG